MELGTSLAYIKGIGQERAQLLQKYMGLQTLEDLLFFFPLRHIDKTKIYTIDQLRSVVGEEVQLKGKMSGFTEIPYGNKQKRLKAVFRDEKGIMELVWFQYSPKMLSYLQSLNEVYIYGVIQEFNGFYSMPHPEIETPDEREVWKSLIPLYPSSEKLAKRGLNQKFFRSVIRNIFKDRSIWLEENLPPYLLEKYRLPERNIALLSLHFPDDLSAKNTALKRLKLEEALIFLTTQHIRKVEFNSLQKGIPMPVVGNYFKDFFEHHLPFSLTQAQSRVIKEIRRDMKSGKQMNRLLQGDVGSGKTIVALFSMLMAADNGYQSCLMAPTEILAQQHFFGISQLLDGFPVRVELLTGSTRAKKRREIRKGLQDGSIHILVGTHALLEDPVQFQKLGLAVIDEQHRFGVAQRSRLWNKNNIPPHILLMTATPIPRTLAMTYYADLQVSVIDELPKGRKPIITAHRKEKNLYEVNRFVEEQLKLGRQAYFVFPLIEESEALGYKNVLKGYEDISSDFPNFRVEMLHGGMKNEEKDRAMREFKTNRAQILVSTTVIEVGVNVPNASVMVIQNADKFGLSQLHQLRGRVGRGSEQSYCILMTDDKMSADGRKRIKTMCNTQDGFKISEVDLQIRGAGDIMGTRQSGSIEFKVLDLKEDGNVIQFAKNTLQKILEKDPYLQHPQHQILKKAAEYNLRTAKKWAKIS